MMDQTETRDPIATETMRTSESGGFGHEPRPEAPRIRRASRETRGTSTRSSLPAARAALIAAIEKDTPGTDLPRFVAVLDALIAWSVARPDQLTFRSDGARSAVLGFARAGSKAAFWSVQVTRGVGPKLEISSPIGTALSAEERANVLETLNAHSRAVLVEGDRMRIGFGALKNAAAQAAVLALLDRLLVSREPRADTDPVR